MLCELWVIHNFSKELQRDKRITQYMNDHESILELNVPPVMVMCESLLVRVINKENSAKQMIRSGSKGF